MKSEDIEKLDILNEFEASTKESIELLKQDVDLQKDNQLFKGFLSALKENQKVELFQKMETWNQESQRAQTGAAPKDISVTEKIPQATLERLFASVPAYEQSIGQAMRGAGFKLLHPINEFDWNKNPFPIDVENKNSEALYFEIENNEQALLAEGQLDLNQNSIAFNFDTHLPGRYYLRIFNDEHFVLQSFYIRKDLIPN